MRWSNFISFCFLFLLFSCKKTGEGTAEVLNQWLGKKIIFPSELYFTIQNKDTIWDIMENKSSYSVLCYVDTAGCTSCKMQLQQWDRLIREMNSLSLEKIFLRFIIYPKNIKDVTYFLKSSNFNHPVCLDYDDIFNKINKLPLNDAFRTFLLNKDNDIVAIGNPIYNSKVKELYLNIIQEKSMSFTKQKGTSITTVLLSNRLFKLGTFSWQQPQTATFSFKNTGTLPLVIQDVSTSCGCTTVEYDPKPVQPGGSLDIQVTYKAEHPEHFDKTVTVYCNAEDSPIVLKIQGNAE